MSCPRFILYHKFQLPQESLNYESLSLNQMSKYIDICRKDFSSVDTGRKLNVHKTFRRRPARLLNVLYTFNLRPLSTGIAMKKDAKWSLHRFFLIFNYAYPFKLQPHIMVKDSHAIHFIQFIWVCLTILWGWRLKGEHPNKVFEYTHIHTSRTLKRKKSLSKSLHDVTQFHICYHCPIVANNVILLTRNNTLNNF